MELALHMGMPADLMLKTMTEYELHQWGNYASKHALPFRRMEILLAQIAWVMAKTMGNAKNATLNDFMLKAPEDMPSNVTNIDEMRRAFGFKPRKVKG